LSLLHVLFCSALLSSLLSLFSLRSLLSLSKQTRIQISSEFADLGMFGTIKKVSGEEGVLGLWKGVNAAWLREASYTSLRLGLYEPIKVVFGCNDPATATFAGKFLAGSAAGAIGSVAGNPVSSF
jgi:hypothetical protein